MRHMLQPENSRLPYLAISTPAPLNEEFNGLAPLQEQLDVLRQDRLHNKTAQGEGAGYTHRLQLLGTLAQADH